METSLKALLFSSLISLTLALNTKRQFPTPLNVRRRVDGNLVLGTANEADNPNPIEAAFVPSEETIIENVTPSIPSIQASNKLDIIDEDPGFIDSILGDGVQSRIVGSLSNWVMDKVRTNPGCVERFVCETYRTGENLSGFPYLFMSLTNAAVSFMVADMFDQSVNIKEITRAARTGRTVGSCHAMKCDFMEGQLRNWGDYYETLEEFVSSVFNSLSNSFNLPF